MVTQSGVWLVRNWVHIMLETENNLSKKSLKITGKVKQTVCTNR